MEKVVEIPHRHEIAKFVEKNAKSGDVLYRGSEAKGPYGLPFMKIVSKLTKSHYTHAATVFWEGDDLMVVEMTDIGTMQYRFIDWLDFCLGGHFALYRLDGIEESQRLELLTHIKSVLAIDPSYDYTFADPNKFYCTEFVAWLYNQIGVEIAPPRTILEVVGPKRFWVVSAGNWVYGKLTRGKVCLNTQSPLYYVGNEANGGLLASKKMIAIVSKNPYH